MAGWKVRVIPEVVVQHAQGTTTRRMLGASTPYYLGYRNRLRSILANSSAPTLVRVLPKHVGACLLIIIGFALSARFAAAGAVLRGLLWPAVNVADVRRQRREAQALRKLPDKEIFTEGLTTTLSPRRALQLFHGNVRRWKTESESAFDAI